MSEFIHCCPEMSAAVQDDDYPVIFVPKFREYGLLIGDGGTSYQLIHYCPWCGSRLPETLRNEWFEKLESMSIDPMDEDAIPEKFRNEAWYTNEG